MSCLSIAGAYHLDFTLPQWLTAQTGGRLGPNPFMLLLLLLVLGGCIVAAAVPLRESTLLLYNARTRVEVRLNEWHGYTREPTNVPGRTNRWVGVCAGAYDTMPPELREQRAQRQHHVLFLACVALGLAAKLAKSDEAPQPGQLPRETWDGRVG